MPKNWRQGKWTKEPRSAPFWLRWAVFERDNYTCLRCGCQNRRELCADHIIPWSKGGRTREDNLQTLCWKCNSSKHDKTINYRTGEIVLDNP